MRELNEALEKIKYMFDANALDIALFCKSISKKKKHRSNRLGETKMIINIYSIKDVKVAFKQPFYTHNDSAAKRMFENAVNDKINVNNELSMNPEDYELWHIAKFDDETGKISECEPKFIVKGIDLIKE